MKIISSCMKLFKLEGENSGIDFIESSGMKEKKQFTCQNPFGITFRYIHKVDDHNNRRHAPMYLDNTRETKFCPDHNFVWYLAVSEVNTALASGHFQNYG